MGTNSPLLGKDWEDNSCPTIPAANLSTVAHKHNVPSKVSTVLVINVYCSGVNEVFFVTTLLPPGIQTIETSDKPENRLTEDVTEADDKKCSYSGPGQTFESSPDNMDCNCILFPVPIGNCPEPCVPGLLVNRGLVTPVSNLVAVHQSCQPKQDAEVPCVEGKSKEVVTPEASKVHTKELKLTCPDGNGHGDERKEEVVCCGSDRENSALP